MTNVVTQIFFSETITDYSWLHCKLNIVIIIFLTPNHIDYIDYLGITLCNEILRSENPKKKNPQYVSSPTHRKVNAENTVQYDEYVSVGEACETEVQPGGEQEH